MSFGQYMADFEKKESGVSQKRAGGQVSEQERLAAEDLPTPLLFPFPGGRSR